MQLVRRRPDADEELMLHTVVAYADMAAWGPLTRQPSACVTDLQW